MDEFTPPPPPPTEPSGALRPPPKPPATALATASPAPRPHRPEWVQTMREGSFSRLVARTLDAVDEVADSIANALGLRHG
jgi:hypothetical protein